MISDLRSLRITGPVEDIDRFLATQTENYYRDTWEDEATLTADPGSMLSDSDLVAASKEFPTLRFEVISPYRVSGPIEAFLIHNGETIRTVNLYR